MKKITVIVAAYNAEKYIERCLASIVCKNAEVDIVVVNDASTDGTAEKIGKFGGKLKLVNLEKNSGCVARVRNIGLENAEGEYITYLDADDWYENGALDRIADCLQRYNPDILKYGYTAVYPDGTRRAVPACEGWAEKKDFPQKVYPLFLDGIELNSVCCAVFRKSILGGTTFPEEFCTAEDAAFCAEAYTKAQSIMFLPDCLYCYYQSGTGLTGKGMKILKKYKYNFMLSGRLLRLLPAWGMDTPRNRVRAVLRPVKITLDKLKRI